jgi:hypothetical protein
MLSKINNNYYKPNHLVDDWGFYIDLESIQPIPNNEEKIRQKYKVKNTAFMINIMNIVMMFVMNTAII